MAYPVWQAVDSTYFFSKKDSRDIRFGDLVSSCSLPPFDIDADIVIWGYPDDEGIQMNGGRVGAAHAPDQIRQFFYKMTPNAQISKHPRLIDFGNLSKQISLFERHQKGSAIAKAFSEKHLHWLSLGGGHDYGYADGSGFIQAKLIEKKRPVVINFDAHLDVRPTDKGYNSGTPFFRLLTEFPGQFDFIEVGIQPQCNSSHHLDWAKKQGAQILHLNEINSQGLLHCLKKALGSFQGRPLWFSLDMDALTSNEAPGCSQSWTTGLKSDEVLSSMSWFKSHFDWKSFSIYEVSPPLDQDHRTSKLAALFAHHFTSLTMADASEKKHLYGGE